MNRNEAIEKNVSDAITAKPIRFSVKYTQKETINIETTEKVAVHRLLPFLHKEVKSVKTEEKVRDMVNHFEMHPPTLGKMQILSKLYLQLEFDEEALSKSPHVEAMRICEEHTDIICQLMAVSVCRTESELLDDAELTKKADLFKWHCTPEDFSNCLLAMLTQTDYENFMISMRLMKMLRLNKPTEQRASRIE